MGVGERGEVRGDVLFSLHVFATSRNGKNCDLSPYTEKSTF